MLRLRKKLPSALLRALIAWLLALGLGMPLLCGAGLHFLLPRYALICAGVSLCCAALSLRRWLFPLALGGLILLQLILFILGQGFFQQTLTLGRALLLLLRDMPLATALHGDWLCLQLAVYLTLFCDALSSPDIDAALPVTIVAGILSTEWMMGLRQESLYMLPVLPALLLIYAHTYSYQSAPPTHQPRTSPWAIPAAAVLLALALLLSPRGRHQESHAVPPGGRIAGDNQRPVLLPAGTGSIQPGKRRLDAPGRPSAGRRAPTQRGSDHAGGDQRDRLPARLHPGRLHRRLLV